MTDPAARGIITYNPLNLRYRPDQPNARAGNTGFGEYPDMPTGIAANLRQLLIDQDAGIRTIGDHVKKWVNDPKADLRSYIADLSEALGVPSDKPIDLRDPKMAQAYIMAAQPHESGPTKLSPDDASRGVTMALGDNSPAMTKGGVIDRYLNPVTIDPGVAAGATPASTAQPDEPAMTKGGVIDRYLNSETAAAKDHYENPPSARESFRVGVEHAFRNFYDTIGLGNSPAIQQSDAQYGYQRPTEEQYKARYGDSLAASTGNMLGNLVATAPLTVPTGALAEGIAAKVAAPVMKSVIASTGVANPVTETLPVASKLVQTSAGNPTLANAFRVAGAAAEGAEASKLSGESGTMGALGGAAFGGGGLLASQLAPYMTTAASKNMLLKYAPDAVGAYLAWRYGSPTMGAFSTWLADPVITAATGAGIGETAKKMGGAVATKLGPYAPYLGAPAGLIGNNTISPLIDPSYLPP